MLKKVTKMWKSEAKPSFIIDKKKYGK